MKQVKIFFITTFIINCLILNVNAESNIKYYVGTNISTNNGEANNDKSTNTNFSLNLGIKKIYLQNLYIGLETYINTGNIYDNKYYTTWGTSNYSNQDIKVQNLTGLKVNLGYNINEKFSIFGNVDFKLIDFKYTDNGNEAEFSGYYSIKHNINSIQPSFGIGISYSLNNNWSLSSNYSFANITIKDSSDAIFGDDLKIDVNSFNININYIF